MPSSVTIDGITIRGDALATTQAFTAAMSIIDSGKPRLLVLDGREDATGERMRSAFYVTRTTTVSMVLVEERGNPTVIPIFEDLAPNAGEILAESDAQHRSDISD